MYKIVAFLAFAITTCITTSALADAPAKLVGATEAVGCSVGSHPSTVGYDVEHKFYIYGERTTGLQGGVEVLVDANLASKLPLNGPITYSVICGIKAIGIKGNDVISNQLETKWVKDGSVANVFSAEKYTTASPAVLIPTQPIVNGASLKISTHQSAHHDFDHPYASYKYYPYGSTADILGIKILVDQGFQGKTYKTKTGIKVNVEVIRTNVQAVLVSGKDAGSGKPLDQMYILLESLVPTYTLQ